MNLHSILRPEVVIAALLILAPMLLRRFSRARIRAWRTAMPRPLRIAAPALLCVPYALVAQCLPHVSLGVAGALRVAAGGHRVFCWIRHAAPTLTIAATGAIFWCWPLLGLAVDLRWFEPAWPRGYSRIRQDAAARCGHLRLSRRAATRRSWFRSAPEDCATSASGCASFASTRRSPSRLGWAWAFSTSTRCGRSRLQAIGAFVFTFLFIAIPEELFFRGWLQNLLERRIGRTAALAR